MQSLESLPNENVLRLFRVELMKPLGGRNNRHWLVQRHGQHLVLRLWPKARCDIDYEVRILKELHQQGYPVAPVIEGLPYEGATWCLFPYIPGDPDAVEDAAAQRRRGRLLAEFHAHSKTLSFLRQRPQWRRCEDILSDRQLDRILVQRAGDRPEEVSILQRHLERARERIAALRLEPRPTTLIHGDFTRWNLLFDEGKLVGVLDFEHAHLDNRVADLAISWRGKYDDVIRGYNEVSRLEPVELETLTPIWWAFLIQQACALLTKGTSDDGWIMTNLLQSSPLMGADAEFIPF